MYSYVCMNIVQIYPGVTSVPKLDSISINFGIKADQIACRLTADLYSVFILLNISIYILHINTVIIEGYVAFYV